KSDPVQDYTTLQSLDSMKLSPLDFVLPRQLRRLVYARGVSAYGLRSATPLFAALCVSLLMLISMKTINTKVVPPTVAVKPAGLAQDPRKNAPAVAVTGDKGAPDGIRLIKGAPPAQISLSTDLTGGTLSVDGAEVARVQAGETEIPSLA